MRVPAARKQQSLTWDYDRSETIADGAIHVFGLALAIAGAAVLAVIVARTGSATRITAAGVYLAGLLATLGISAAYNLWPVSPIKWRLRQFDHSAIYLLIAASYTAFVLPMKGTGPATLLAAIWLIAVAGMMIKIAWPRRFDRTSIALYLVMGWSGVLVLWPIVGSFSPITLLLIGAGGAFYSLGVVFHVWNQLRFQNAIWHGFVLAAAACHYAAAFEYLPAH